MQSALRKMLSKHFPGFFPPPDELKVQPHDASIVVFQKRGSVCDDPNKKCGICMEKVYFQSFAQGKLLQELVGRQSWVRVGPLLVHTDFLWREPKTGKKKSLYYEPHS